jgi:hypothetical protein
MGDIYSCANTVLVWLGSSYSENIGEFVKRLNLAKRAEARKAEREGDKALRKPGLAFKPSSTEELHLLEICNHSYWTRTWVIQEMVPARKARLVLGTHDTSRVTFKKALKATLSVFQRVPRDRADKCFRANSRYKTHQYFGDSLCEVIGRLCDGSWPDSRDQVYAILTLVPGAHWLSVSYSVTKEELLCSTMLSSCAFICLCGDSTYKTESVARPLPNLPYFLQPADSPTVSFKQCRKVARALNTSYGTLDGYLKERSDLGLATHIVLTLIILSPAAELRSNSVQYSCTMDDSAVAGSGVFLGLSVRVGTDGRQRLDCTAIFEPGKHHRALIPNMRRYECTSLIDGILEVSKMRMLVPFSVFASLVLFDQKVLAFYEHE